MDFIARAFMAAWLAGLLALAHAGYDHSLAETYQWAQQLTHGALRAEPPACLCGARLPSRLHLMWSCESTAVFRQGLQGPAD